MSYIDRNVFIGLYKSLVRPLLETSVSVWNPYMVKQIKQLEVIQEEQQNSFVASASYHSMKDYELQGCQPFSIGESVVT